MQPKISITGDLGSGKSAVSKVLHAQLGYEIYSTGNAQRQLAQEMGMTTLELNQYSETHPEIDDRIDGVFKALNESPEGLIVDSRMAWHFMPSSFKIFLMVPVEVAAQRIMGDSSRKREIYTDLEHAVRDLKARKGSENKRFLDKYDVDCTDPGNFDLAINTANISPEQVARIILAGLEIVKGR